MTAIKTDPITVIAPKKSAKSRITAASDYTDRAFFWIKWPIAVVAVVLLPMTLVAFFGSIAGAAISWTILPLLGGTAIYFALWWGYFKDRKLGSFLATLEHELTHALFALVTLHPVTGIKSSWRRGGHLTFKGKGNWLITIAPYFFPLPCMLLLGTLWLFPENLQNYSHALIGMGLGYHFTSTFRETHSGQSDLKQVGWLFSLMFLPFANLFCLGMIFSFVSASSAGIGEFFRSLVWFL